METKTETDIFGNGKGTKNWFLQDLERRKHLHWRLIWKVERHLPLKVRRWLERNIDL